MAKVLVREAESCANTGSRTCSLPLDHRIGSGRWKCSLRIRVMFPSLGRNEVLGQQREEAEPGHFGD